MAGSQDPNENPVAINVVPMVDVIFCLCVFFMCSMKFKELEGKFQAWLPKDKGQSMPSNDVPAEIRFALKWDDANQKTVIEYGRRAVTDNAEIQKLIRDAKADFERIQKTDVPVIIDGDQRVPWKEVLNIVNLAKRESVEKIEFAAGVNYDNK